MDKENYRKMKNIAIYIVAFYVLIQTFSSLEAQCPPRSEVSKQTEWMDYNKLAPASGPFVYADKMIYLSNEAYSDELYTDADSVVIVTPPATAKTTYIVYPYVAQQKAIVKYNNVTVTDPVTAQTITKKIAYIIYRYAWEQVPTDFLGAEGIEVVQRENVLGFDVPKDEAQCPAFEYKGIQLRTDKTGNVQYRYWYEEYTYRTEKEPFTGVTQQGSAASCVSYNEGQEVKDGGNTLELFDGPCNKNVDTNGDTFQVTGQVISYTGGTLKGNTFTPTSKGWTLRIKGGFKKVGGAYADFIIVAQ